MSKSTAPIPLNSPAVRKAARKAGLTVPEFVEMSVLLTMENVRNHPLLFESKNSGRTHLKILRKQSVVIAKFGRMSKEAQQRILEDPLFKDLNLTQEK